MANKFVDQNGLLYFWQKILAKFQKKEDGKGLSTNDYTTDEKNVKAPADFLPGGEQFLNFSYSS